jgi:hypothetical protein
MLSDGGEGTRRANGTDASRQTDDNCDTGVVSDGNAFTVVADDEASVVDLIDVIRGQ